MSDESAGRCIGHLLKFVAATTRINATVFSEMTANEKIALVAWGERKDLPETITMQEVLDLFHAQKEE